MTRSKREIILEEIKEKNAKRSKLEKKIYRLEKKAELLSSKAEKKGNFSTLLKADSLRSQAKVLKDEEVSKVTKLVTDMEHKLKTLFDLYVSR